MPQMSIYLNAEIAERLAHVADSEGISHSRWLARLVERTLAKQPGNALASLYGSLANESFERPVQPPARLDSPRETL